VGVPLLDALAPAELEVVGEAVAVGEGAVGHVTPRMRMLLVSVIRTSPVAGLNATPRGELIMLVRGFESKSLQQPPVPAKVPIAPVATLTTRTRLSDVSTSSSLSGRYNDSCAVLNILAAAPVPSAKPMVPPHSVLVDHSPAKSATVRTR
jgi:hypothetical protein